jgi:hypothetical protein
VSDFQVILTHDIYDRTCIEAAAEKYRSSIIVSRLRRDAKESVLALSAQGDGPLDERIVRDFLNHLLDLSIRAALEAA